MTKIEQSIKLIKKTEKLALKYRDFGFHVAFSGGKDSQVIYELCKMAGVKFKAFCYDTSVMSIELRHFIRENYPDIEWIRAIQTMYQLIIQEKMLPMKNKRYCCRILKERQGLNSVVISGIRKSENPMKRGKRNDFEMRCIKGEDKILLNPILDWTKNNIEKFIKERNITICSEYNEFKRNLSCVGCPQNSKEQRKAFRKYPNFKKAYINTVKKIMKQGKFSQFESAEDVIDWWSSGISVKKWLANKNQYKITYK